jgi:FkbM family methyltransferase
MSRRWEARKRISLEFVPLLLRAYLWSWFLVRPDRSAWEYYRTLLLALPVTLLRRRVTTPNDLLRGPIVVRFRGLRYWVSAETVFAYYLLPFEPGTAQHLWTRTGRLFVDLGANIGQYTLALSRRFELVVAVEPNPAALAILKRNLDLNGIENVRIQPVAVAAAAGKLPLYGGEFLSTWSLKHPSTEFVLVDVITLDTLLAGLGPVDLLKVDIEGAEREVFLAGAEPLRRVRELSFEMDLGEGRSGTPPEAQAVFDFLQREGFSVRILRSPFRERENIEAERVGMPTSAGPHGGPPTLAPS